MCGIAGVFCWGDSRPTPDIIKGLLLANELRGKDASGVAFLNEDGNDIIIRKDKMTAKDFVKAIPESDWEAIASSRTILLHTRAKTKGDAAKNENNHPIYSEPYKWVVTHNGNVKNDDDLWYHYGKDHKRFADVDTSVVPLVLSQGKTPLESLGYLSLLQGNATLAAWNELDKEHLLLARFGDNELYMFLDEDEGILYWSSALQATEVVPATGLSRLRFVNISRLPEDRVLLLGPDIEKTEMFKVTRSPFSLPKGGSGRSKTSTTMGRQSTGTGASKTVSDSKRPAFRWQRNDPSTAAFKTRPHPLWDLVKMAPCRIETCHGDFNRQPNLQALTVHTPYGRWIFRREHGNVSREFNPHKRWTRWLRSEFNDGKALPYPDMPVPVVLLGSSGATKYDNKMPFESLFLTETLGTGKVTKLYYVCPWCGVHEEARGFMNRFLRCAFCNIRSTVEPVSEGVVT